MFKYIVKNADGDISLETIFEKRAEERARRSGYKLLKVPVTR